MKKNNSNTFKFSIVLEFIKFQKFRSFYEKNLPDKWTIDFPGSETGAQTPNVLKFENKHFSIFD